MPPTLPPTGTHGPTDGGPDTGRSGDAEPRSDEPVGPLRSRTGLLTLLFLAVLVGAAAMSTIRARSDPAADPIPPTQENATAAPDFEVPLLDGEGTFSLARHLAEDGRPLVLNLWASWCLPCREEMPDIDAAARRHPELAFLGVAVEDDLASARGFAFEVGVSYPLAFDGEAIMAARYPYLGLPATYLIDGDGVLRRTVFGQLTEATLERHIAEAFGDGP